MSTASHPLHTIETSQPVAHSPQVRRPRAVAIAGRVGSGKSSVARELAARHGWNVISFGAYVRAEAERRGMEITREQLQVLGETLFEALGPTGILRAAVASSGPRTEIHVIDGIRHITVWKVVQSEYYDAKLLFLNSSETERYRRFLARSDYEEFTPSFESFVEMDSKPIEQGIDALEEVADVVLDANNPQKLVLGRVEQALRDLGFAGDLQS